MPRAIPLRPLVLLLAAACASPTAGLRAGWRLEGTDTLVHTATGLAFPAQWNGLGRSAPTSEDAAGESVSVRYGGPRHDISLTLFTYPRRATSDPDPGVHFDREILAFVRAHPGARVEENSPMNLPLGYSARAGFGAFVHWGDAGAETGTFLIVAARGDRFYRVTASVRLDGTQPPVDYAWKTLLAFLRMLEPSEQAG